ncbi:MAG: cyclase [Planctomycetota bacterium]|jgi:hypothetical protein
MTTRMFVRHNVNDFGTWKQAYDAFHTTRTELGAQGGEIYQAIDNPNDITAWHDFDTPAAAQAFANSPQLKEAMQNAGVTSTPTIWFANPPG